MIGWACTRGFFRYNKQMRKKWKVHTSKTVYQNPFFRVIEKDLERPDGTISTYYIVDRGGRFSIVIPLFPDGTTLLVGQYRPSTSFYSWEFPMGQVKGKTPLGMAKQELLEETGYRAKEWKFVGSYFIGQGHTSQEAFVYTARTLHEGKARPEEGEFLKTKRVPIAGMRSMIKDGIIKDGPTIAAYQLYQMQSGVSR